jgi:hypothetical protein
MAFEPFGGEFTGERPKENLPKPETPEEAEELGPGARFYMPSGEIGTVPFRPKTVEEADMLPEGAYFIDPHGKSGITPSFKDIDFTANTLYNMAVNDEERKSALERSYPGKVKEHPRTKELYVEDEGGVLRKPRGFARAPGAYLAAQAAPMIGAVGGEIGGAAIGSVSPGPGTVVGGIGGAFVGAAAGQAFNDAILGLAGIYHRGKGEEAAAMGEVGTAAGVGAGVGKVGAAAYPAVKGYLKRIGPKGVASFLGAEQEGLERAIRLRGEGVLVPPSGWAKESPHIHNIVEVFDPTFHTQKPLLQSATEYYERKAGGILERTGAKRPTSLVEAEAAVSAEPAGSAVLQRVAREAATADAAVEQAVQANRAGAQLTSEARAANIERLRIADAQARAAADRVIAAGFDDIQQNIDQAVAATRRGNRSGDLWAQVGEKLRRVKTGISAKAQLRYNQADTIAGDTRPQINGLTELAGRVLQEFPEGFEGRYPAIVKQIRDMAGVMNEAGTGWERPPVSPTFGQLHKLRTALRNNINWYDLTPDFKEGAMKLLAGAVDGALTRPPPGAPAELIAAAEMLNATDAWYGKVIRPLTDKNIQAVLNGLESGMPADPKMLYDTLIKEGRTELTQKVKKLVGPTLWAAVAAADRQEMLNAARTLTPGMIDGRAFVRQVLERQRSGMLEAVHGPQAARLLQQAQNIEMLGGRLPVVSRPGDTITDTIARSLTAADALKEAAKQDPLALLNKEMKAVVAEGNRAKAKLKNQRTADPLGFLHRPTMGAVEAADKILGSEDLILAASARFGDNSPEFEMLRQVWVARILQGTLRPGERLEKVSEEVQRIMFPGATLDDMRILAKDMDFLMATRAARDQAKSMAAQAMVEHPLAKLPKIFGIETGKILNMATLGMGAPAARGVIGWYLKMVRNISNNPAFLRWVMKGLQGDDNAREMVRQTVQQRMRIGGPIGAGAGEFIEQNFPVGPQQ